MTLGGRLQIELLDGFTPEPDDTFDFLLANTFAGSFERFILPTFGDGQTFQLNFGADGVRAAVGPVPLPAAVWLFASALGGFGLCRRRVA